MNLWDGIVFIAYLVFSLLVIIVLNLQRSSSRKDADRLRRQMKMQDMKLTIWYRDGVKIKETLEPVGRIETEDGTLPLPMSLQDGLELKRKLDLRYGEPDTSQPGTRIPGMDERK